MLRTGKPVVKAKNVTFGQVLAVHCGGLHRSRPEAAAAGAPHPPPPTCYTHLTPPHHTHPTAPPPPQLQCDVPVERQRLLHKGRDMDNQAKLSAYSTGSEIVLFFSG